MGSCEGGWVCGQVGVCAGEMVCGCLGEWDGRGKTAWVFVGAWMGEWEGGGGGRCFCLHAPVQPAGSSSVSFWGKTESVRVCK